MNVKTWTVCLVAAWAPYKKVYHGYHLKRFNAKFRIAADSQIVVALGMSQYKTNRKIVNRVEVLPEFYQALMDVTTAMLEGRIKTKPEKVRDGIANIFARAFQPNDTVFYAAVNELKNISNGMATF